MLHDREYALEGREELGAVLLEVRCFVHDVACCAGYHMLCAVWCAFCAIACTTWAVGGSEPGGWSIEDPECEHARHVHVTVHVMQQGVCLNADN